MDLINQKINQEDVCRIAPATLGLVTRTSIIAMILS